MATKNMTRQVKTLELGELDKKHFLHPTTNLKEFVDNGRAIVFAEGKGVTVISTDGKEYIDGMSMLWNVNIGMIIENLRKQVRVNY